MRKDHKYPVDDPRVIACKKAVKNGGGPYNIARYLDISPQAVCNWEVVPKDRCHKVAKLSKMSIFELRPDIFKTRKRQVRGSKNANANPARPASKEMERRAAAGGEGVDSERRDRFRGGAGDGYRPQSSLGPDIQRPGIELASLPPEGENSAPSPAATAAATGKNSSTDTGRCGYGGRSW